MIPDPEAFPVLELSPAELVEEHTGRLLTEATDAIRVAAQRFPTDSAAARRYAADLLTEQDR